MIAARDRFNGDPHPLNTIHPLALSINKDFKKILSQRKQDMKAGKQVDSFDTCFAEIFITVATEIQNSDDMLKSYHLIEGTTRNDAFDIVEDRITDAFCDNLIERDEDIKTTAEEIENIRGFIEDITGFSDREQMYIDDEPQARRYFKEAYSNWRLLEKFFCKYKNKLSS